jgi:hypothetical protein
VAFSFGTNVPEPTPGDAAVAVALGEVAALATSGPAIVAPITPPVSRDAPMATPTMILRMLSMVFTSSNG